MKLKKYDDYFNKILAYAAACGITVYFKDGVNGAYFLSCRRIYINPSYSNSETIAMLLHELGHFVDDIEQKQRFDKLYAKAAAKIDQEKSLGSREFNCLMLCEAMAWEKGRELAVKLKIPLGKWFYKMESYSLLGYMNVKKNKNTLNN